MPKVAQQQPISARRGAAAATTDERSPPEQAPRQSSAVGAGVNCFLATTTTSVAVAAAALASTPVHRKHRRMPTAAIWDFGARHLRRTPTANRIRRQRHDRPSAPASQGRDDSSIMRRQNGLVVAFAWRTDEAILDRPRCTAALFTGLPTPGDCSSLIKRESSRSGAHNSITPDAISPPTPRVIERETQLVPQSAAIQTPISP
jgi:hypothetical protein